MVEIGGGVERPVCPIGGSLGGELDVGGRWGNRAGERAVAGDDEGHVSGVRQSAARRGDGERVGAWGCAAGSDGQGGGAIAGDCGGAKAPVAPVGNPLTDKATLAEKPFSGETVTV